MPTDHKRADLPTTHPAAPPRRRFTLSGPSADLDPTDHAIRGDLADVELADRVFAPHYARAAKHRVTRGTTVFARPDISAPATDTLAPGDAVALFDINAGWCWIQTANGVGYVPADTVVPL